MQQCKGMYTIYLNMWLLFLFHILVFSFFFLLYLIVVVSWQSGCNNIKHRIQVFFPKPFFAFFNDLMRDIRKQVPYYTVQKKNWVTK